jgi:hypothetical protein
VPALFLYYSTRVVLRNKIILRGAIIRRVPRLMRKYADGITFFLRHGNNASIFVTTGIERFEQCSLRRFTQRLASPKRFRAGRSWIRNSMFELSTQNAQIIQTEFLTTIYKRRF